LLSAVSDEVLEREPVVSAFAMRTWGRIPCCAQVAIAGCLARRVVWPDMTKGTKRLRLSIVCVVAAACALAWWILGGREVAPAIDAVAEQPSAVHAAPSIATEQNAASSAEPVVVPAERVAVAKEDPAMA
jgi:hypothetical protein